MAWFKRTGRSKTATGVLFALVATQHAGAQTPAALPPNPAAVVPNPAAVVPNPAGVVPPPAAAVATPAATPPTPPAAAAAAAPAAPPPGGLASDTLTTVQTEIRNQFLTSISAAMAKAAVAKGGSPTAAPPTPTVAVTVTPLFNDQFDVLVAGQVPDIDTQTAVITGATAAQTSLNSVQAGVTVVPTANLHATKGTITVTPLPPNARFVASQTILGALQGYFAGSTVVPSVRILPATDQYQLVLTGTPSPDSLAADSAKLQQLIATVNKQIKPATGTGPQLVPEVIGHFGGGFDDRDKIAAEFGALDADPRITVNVYPAGPGADLYHDPAGADDAEDMSGDYYTVNLTGQVQANELQGDERIAERMREQASPQTWSALATLLKKREDAYVGEVAQDLADFVAATPELATSTGDQLTSFSTTLADLGAPETGHAATAAQKAVKGLAAEVAYQAKADPDFADPVIAQDIYQDEQTVIAAIKLESPNSELYWQFEALWSKYHAIKTAWSTNRPVVSVVKTLQKSLTPTATVAQAITALAGASAGLPQAPPPQSDLTKKVATELAKLQNYFSAPTAYPALDNLYKAAFLHVPNDPSVPNPLTASDRASQADSIDKLVNPSPPTIFPNVPPLSLAQFGKLSLMLRTSVAIRDYLAIADQNFQDIWRVTSLGQTGPADSTSTGSPIDATVNALNKVFGTPTSTVAYRDNSNIYLSTTLSTALKAKGLLSLLDEIPPQVKLSLWSVQMAGDQGVVSTNMANIKADYDATSGRIEETQELMAEALKAYYTEHYLSFDPTNYNNLIFADIYKHVFVVDTADLQDYFPATAGNSSTNPLNRTLSLVQTLLFTGALKQREDILDTMTAVIGYTRSKELWTLCQQWNAIGAVDPRVEEAIENQELDYQKVLTVEAPDTLTIDPTGNLTFNPSPTSTAASTGEPDAITTQSLNDRAESDARKLDPLLETGREEILRAAGFTGKRKSGAAGAAQDAAREIYFRWRVLQSENQAPCLPAMKLIERPTAYGSDMATVYDFLKRLRNYHRLIRALGVYDTPQGALILHHPGIPIDDSTPIDDGTGEWLHENPSLTQMKNSRAPEDLKVSGYAVDGLIGHTVDAYESDVESTYLSPLLERIQNGEYINRDGLQDGIAVSSRSDITVDDRRPAALTAAVSSYVNDTAPAPYGQDLLGVLGSSSSGLGAATTLTTPAILAAVAALAQAPPTYLNVAPGINLTVTPEAAADGSTAELTLAASFGVETTPPTLTGSSNLQPKIPSAVNTHAVTTEATLDGEKLLAISSFDIETSTPRGPQYVPVLGRLPIIGQAFQFPQKPDHTDYQSLILVEANILPRALPLLGFYNATEVRHVTTLPGFGRIEQVGPNDFSLRPGDESAMPSNWIGFLTE